MQKIEFVYFDVGGVVIDDFSGTDKWEQLKQELGVTADIDDAFTKNWFPLEHEVLVGRDIETLLPVFRETYGLAIPETYSLLNGFVSRFNANEYILPVIEKAKRNAGVGLLTNMYPGMLEAIKRKGILPPAAWDAVVDSSIEMLKKPDDRLFELAEQKAHSVGSNILFIDNTIGHINAAQAFGWQTYFYDATSRKESCEKLNDYLDTVVWAKN